MNPIKYYEKYGNFTDRELISDYINAHRRAGTLIELEDSEGEIYAWARFNVWDDVCEALDLWIRSDKQGFSIIRKMIEEAKRRFPSMRKVYFERGLKRPGDGFRELKIKERD